MDNPFVDPGNRATIAVAPISLMFIAKSRQQGEYL
jgi:hypothetical protein